MRLKSDIKGYVTTAQSQVWAVMILISVFFMAITPVDAAKDPPNNPNIVVIMTDNQGYGGLCCYGGVRAETPRIDKLASEGVQSLDFQVEPGCTPARAAFQTGRMPVHSGNDGSL